MTLSIQHNEKSQQGGPTFKGKEIFGTWTVPKGHVDGDENLFQTAQREFKIVSEVTSPQIFPFLVPLPFD